MRDLFGGALALLLFSGPATAAIVAVDYADFTASAVEDFESYNTFPDFDAIEDIAVGRIGERFSNQALTADGTFDVLGTADPAGDLVAGASGQNINTRLLESSIRIDGIGPTGDTGDGAIAVAFDSPVQAFSIFVIAQGGPFTFDVFGSGGSFLERVTLTTPPQANFLGNLTLASDTNTAEITGFSLFNRDPGGAVYDDIAVGTAQVRAPAIPLPPAAAMLLAALAALVGLGRWRRRTV